MKHQWKAGDKALCLWAGSAFDGTPPKTRVGSVYTVREVYMRPAAIAPDGRIVTNAVCLGLVEAVAPACLHFAAEHFAPAPSTSWLADTLASVPQGAPKVRAAE